MQDAAVYELSSIMEACFLLFSSLRLETLPSSSSIHRHLWASVSRRPAKLYIRERAESARAELVLFVLFIELEVSAILVRFVYLDTPKRTTVGLTSSHINNYTSRRMQSIFGERKQGFTNTADA